MERIGLRKRPICILILGMFVRLYRIHILWFADGGIPGTTELSQLIILQLIMHLLLQHMAENQGDEYEDDEIRPSEVFDFICGSGMGGVFAILFNVFRYTADSAIKFYLELQKRVFSTQGWAQRMRSENLSLLKKVVLELLPTEVLGQQFMTADKSRGRGFICAVNSEDQAHARLLRTYKSREGGLPLSCTVLDAILLSIVDEDHLDPYPLGQFKELFTGSGHRKSNPTQFALREICVLFDDEAPLSCIINIGKGNPGVLTTANTTDGYLSLLRDCEDTANEITRQLSHRTGLFYRLSVPQGFQTPAYDVAKVAAHTNSYLAGSECTILT
ncbi:hypothetical protein DL96DRAFT_501297 [Flagelloscypha sp. PMI_526]|nr:hypothetical protein DL96DRAFT_501297 [Flagelloscypha sp. PMI_526]